MDATEQSAATRVRVGDLARALPGLAFEGPRLALGGLRLLTMRPAMRESIGHIFQRAAARHPDRPFVRFEDREISYGAANTIVNKFASVLAAHGVHPGRTVAILAGNRPETLFAALAAVKLGAAAGMVNTNQRGDVLDHSLRLLDATVLVVGKECRDALAGIEVREPLDLDTLGDAATTEDNPAGTERIMAGSNAFYIFTSGTTGLPKASAMSHYRWLKSMTGIGGLGVRLRGADTLYCCLPLYHNNALTVSLSSVLSAGATLALGRSFSASRFWDEVVRQRATAFCYIGELCRYLLNQPVREAERGHQVRVVVGNGLRPEIWDEFARRFRIPRIAEFYGASECNLAFVNALNLDRTAGICPLPFAVVEYDAETGRPKRTGDRLRKVRAGAVGLLLTKVTDRAPFDGYTDPEATERKLVRDGFTDGDCWFDTGDLVRHQGFKHVAFVDRLGDTFRWKGENVATTEVEGALGEHPDVEQAVVYGVPVAGADGKAGMAAVKLRAGARFDGRGLAAHLAARLPPYAVPLFVRVVDEVEQTSTFKSRKVDLRDQGYSDEVTDPLYVLDDGAYIASYPDYPREVAAGKIRV
ncbi:long-chain-acyl-CoA synthetase [Actinokineospora sp. NBRC 105648]|uniref:long-chain-acyl-CoA synthetase n=1 Tax=Actinokineospora sp. NBRC 105648 TaxID=3032206 RepID=UPI0024A56DD3|nr:long-chain-acyl-CoA synthetase [Actinokineospora sp. NBRC 105648]GLZ41280.1 putative fatty-acid-CoA ligase FadD [Actinokineospora sp. NBRC 105648]